MKQQQHEQVQWYEQVHPIYSYNPRTNMRLDYIKLSDNLSPLTNFVLDVFIHTIRKKNLIVAVPDNVLKIIPLMSYLYGYKEKKSVIVFTQENSGHIRNKVALNHNRNYHLLNKGPDDGGKYLFEEIPMGYLSEGAVEAKIYIPRANRSLRRKYIQMQEKNFLEGRGPKILLCYSEEGSRIIDTIGSLVLDNRKLNGLNVKINPGLILFENVDRFIYSEYSCQLFLKWISCLLDRETKFLLHFANTESKFIKNIRSEIESLVIPFGPSLLKSDYYLRNEAIRYFRNKENSIEWQFLSKYNVDCLDFYRRENRIEISKPLLNAGNIDLHFENARTLLRRIDEEKLVNKRLYYILKRILFNLYNMIVNPSKYRESYGDEVVSWRSYSISELIQIARFRLSDEDKVNRIIMDQFMTEIHCIYLELKECKRYNESNTYSRVSKDYRLFEELGILCTHSVRNIIIATNSVRERSILEMELEKWGMQEDVKVLTIKQINNSMLPRSNATIIFPGPLRMEYSSELLRPYKRVLFLSYEGSNYSWIRDQIELSYGHSLEQCEISLEYLTEIYDFFKFPRNGLLIKHHPLRMNHEVENMHAKWSVREKPEGTMNVFENAKGIMITEPRYKQYKEYEEEMTITENAIHALEKRETDKEAEDGNCYEISLKKLDSEYITDRLLPFGKTYLYLKERGGEVEEGTPRNLKPGYVIVILDNDEKKTSLELVLEIFDLEGSVDKDLITYWKERLAEFIETHNLTYTQFYDLYKKKGGGRSYQTVMNWAKGNVLGPEDPNDLFTIGKILENENIIEDFHIIDREVRNLRIIHQSTGRILKGIIRQIVNGRLDPSKLSYGEYRLYEKIEDGLYEIISIQKNPS